MDELTSSNMHQNKKRSEADISYSVLGRKDPQNHNPGVFDLATLGLYPAVLFKFSCVFYADRIE